MDLPFFSGATPTVFEAVKNLKGRHRIQRVPPNEKNGRRHSSEITVAVLSHVGAAPVLRDQDVKVETQRGSGPGGQHRNKVESMVRVTHLPTKLVAVCDGRSQSQNRQRALEVLAARVEELHTSKMADSRNRDRRSQLGGERTMTWTTWRDQVVNHRSGRKAKMSLVLKGNLDRLLSG